MRHFASLLLPLLCLTPVQADYATDAEAAIKTLNDKWYNVDTGLWDNLWWQSGNMVETIAKFGLEDPAFRPTAEYIVSNTYEKSRNQFGYKDWKNDFYDDMGWWAMGWIASYDLTSDIKYLNTAADIFEDMTGGWTTPCGGGIWWDKKHTQIAAISNELFMTVSASLATRSEDPAVKQYYVSWAQMEWDWFKNSGIINEKGLVNDGIDQHSCKNDQKNTWTYNQGVVLAGLSEMAKARSDGGFIKHAYALANAAISQLSKNGILTEPVDGPLDETSAQFKGVFTRGLSTLNENEPQPNFTNFLIKNAESVREQPKVDGGVIVDRWQGGSSHSNTASHAAGIDALVAAATA